MTADPRSALSDLVAALERHLETCAARRGDDDPAVSAAYDQVAESFVAYDEALMDAYGEATPLDVFEDDDFDDDDEDEDDESEDDFDDDADDSDGDDEDGDDEDSPYLGLDDEEFDVDERPRA